jgi:light-regulated signal transduction histidine kinase (bacteriophytochrome)
VALDPLVADIIKEIKSDLPDRRIEWIIHQLPNVRADRSLLRLVFVNLIENAVKFTSKRPEARIDIGTAAGASGETVIFVRDNGAGFNQAYAGKLFGVFQRLHSQVEFEGTGIGLANVERIVRRHGGRVWAEGAVNQGATFSITIPDAA